MAHITGGDDYIVAAAAVTRCWPPQLSYKFDSVFGVVLSTEDNKLQCDTVDPLR